MFSVLKESELGFIIQVLQIGRDDVLADKTESDEKKRPLIERYDEILDKLITLKADRYSVIRCGQPSKLTTVELDHAKLLVQLEKQLALREKIEEAAHDEEALKEHRETAAKLPGILETKLQKFLDSSGETIAKALDAKK